MSLITPLEPDASFAATRPAPAHDDPREASHALLFGRVACAVASSCGSLHAVNEDAHSAIDAGPPFVVADGVGGGAMASLASRQLVAHLHAGLQGQRLDADSVCKAMLEADRLIAERIAAATQRPGAATVALCAPVNAFASRWLIAWVGDCRVYQCRAHGEPAVHALTRDDSFHALGETPGPGSAPHDPARMVGNGAVSRANVLLADVAPGDVLLLCSDGVHKSVADDDWPRLLKRPLPLAQLCDELIAHARAKGSVDDATALLLRRDAPGARRAQWLRGLVARNRNQP